MTQARRAWRLSPCQARDAASFKADCKALLLLIAPVILSGCASTAPVSIGGDTYYASKTNTAGIFGDVSAVAGSLMVEGNHYCATKARQFELLTENTTQNIPGVRLGGASITFKCVQHSQDAHMRPDNGVSTEVIEQ